MGEGRDEVEGERGNEMVLFEKFTGAICGCYGCDMKRNIGWHERKKERKKKKGEFLKIWRQ
jgi:hypothetical protein